jgi:broad specificity phosphatase PhoE
MTLILMRHGATEWNLQGRFNSRTELPLSTGGISSVRAAAVRLARLPISAIYCSPALRASETAALVQAQLPGAVPVQQLDDLREMDFGDYEGRTRLELQAQPETCERYAAWFDPDGAGLVPPGGESWPEASRRAQRVLGELQPITGIALVVGHGYLLRLMLMAALGFGPPQAIRRLRLHNGHCSVISWSDGQWRLHSHNSHEAVQP